MQVNEFATQMKEAAEEFQQLAQDGFKKALSAYFEKYPEVAEIRWQQYTPYFNDGDVCEFSVGNVCVLGNDDAGSDYDGDYWYESGEYIAKKAEALPGGNRWRTRDVPEQRDANELVFAVPDDLMKTIFGDHVRVKIDRAGVYVEEYDHE